MKEHAYLIVEGLVLIIAEREKLWLDQIDETNKTVGWFDDLLACLKNTCPDAGEIIHRHLKKDPKIVTPETWQSQAFDGLDERFGP